MNLVAKKFLTISIGVVSFMLFLGIVAIYYNSRVEAKSGEFVVFTKIRGKNLDDNQIVAPSAEYKGIQKEIMTEGRKFYNMFELDAAVYKAIEIPPNKLGVRVRLFGDDLPYGTLIAQNENQKGIVKDPILPGLHYLNAVVSGKENERPKKDYVEIIELHDPVFIPSGYRGIVINLTGKMPENPNTVISEPGFRGVQKDSLEAGTHYENPYEKKIIPIDCRSQKFNISEIKDIGLSSQDSFWVSIDGSIEFRINPDRASEVYVMYNDVSNDQDNKADLTQEIIDKLISFNVINFYRIQGANNTGESFISGETRAKFQKDFSAYMTESCAKSGVEIVQAVISTVEPPNAIASLVRQREAAKQKATQFSKQIEQQISEAELQTEKSTITQREQLVSISQDLIKNLTKVQEGIEKDMAAAQIKEEAATQHLETAKSLAAAITEKTKTEAAIIDLENQALSSGWKTAIDALGSGEAYARHVYLKKLAPAFRRITVNTADSPLMKVFEDFNSDVKVSLKPSVPETTEVK